MAENDHPDDEEGEPEQEQNQYGGGDEKMDAIEQTKRVTSGTEKDDDEAERDRDEAE